MKTPREILSERHQAAEPKLDAIRRAVVGELNNKGTEEQSWSEVFVTLLLRCPQKLWRELVWPCRRTWAGLAAIWIAIVAFNLTHSERNEGIAAKSTTPTEMRLAFQEQQRLLAELVGPTPSEQPAEPPRRNNNQPRSGRMPVLTMV